MVEFDWIKVTAVFPKWKETGPIEAKMDDGSIVRGWILGLDEDTDGSVVTFEFELDSGRAGDLSRITEYRRIE